MLWQLKTQGLQGTSRWVVRLNLHAWARQPNLDCFGTFLRKVTLQNTGELIHSKSTRGDDRCENSTTQQKVIDQIQAYIDSV